MQQIGYGTSSTAVRLAQRMLNNELRREPGYRRLAEDSAFGPLTAAAVAHFQALHHISTEYGVVGPATWRALGLKIDITHPIHMRSQHYDMGCWNASAAMILDVNMSLGTSGAALGNDNSLVPTTANVTQFVTQFGWRVQDAPDDIRTLAAYLFNTPLWCAGGIALDDGSNGGHVVVISGAWGDGTDAGTYIRLHDPWPVNQGAVTVCTYANMHAYGNSQFDPALIAGPI